MAEEKVTVSKEVLAPAEEPREELISTAVKFLQNPKVQSSPLSQRKAFLERKGLTKEEIDLAVERSGVPTQVYPPQPPGLQPPTPGALVPYQQPFVSQVSRWDKIRDVLHTIALIGGLSYAAYKLFKEILQPWILGKPRIDQRLDAIDTMQKSIAETLSKIQETLATMQETMTANQEKVQAISHEVYTQRSSTAMNSISETQFATEMKMELQTLKGLLLNRRQFPPTPASSSLPEWQLKQSAITTTASPKSLVKPSGDATSEEVNLNTNESERTEKELDAEETKVVFSTTSLEETENNIDKAHDTYNMKLDENYVSDEKQVDSATTDKGSDSEVD